MRQIYESGNTEIIRPILTKYNVRYIFLGDLERKSFKNFREEAIGQVAEPVFHWGTTVVYRVSK